MADKLGKLEQSLISGLIEKHSGRKRKEVRVGPSFGVDVSIVDLPKGLSMASSSDPLSLIPSLGLEESAWLSVHLLANDMATTGFAPMYAQFVMNLPASFSKDDFSTYWKYIHQFCNEMGTAICGGHTAFIEGQNSSIAGGGTFSSIAEQGEFLTSNNARQGDAILLTKEAALSSTAILSMSFPKTTSNRLGKEVQEKAASLFYETSSLKDALIAVGEDKKQKAVSAMHDVTEGGVLGAIYELAVASGNGALVYNDQLPIGEVQRQLCDLFSIDPRYCVGAGSMIICCDPEKVNEVLEKLQKENIDCTRVGELKKIEYGIKLMEDGFEAELPYLEEDPYWAAFFRAIKSGWK